MTLLRYLSDGSLFQASAHVVSVKTCADGRIDVVLDETIFYPQGGGQPADNGTIDASSGRFSVSDVRLDQDGIVHHFGSFEHGSFGPGQDVTLLLDAERRVRNSKVHSAGHLIDCVVTQMALPLKPGKGYHFPEGAYVEYEGALDATPELIAELQENINALIKKDIPVRACMVSEHEAREQGLHVPAGKSGRLVAFEGFAPCGCGGTHVKRVGEIGAIVIRKIKSKAGNVRISYDVL